MWYYYYENVNSSLSLSGWMMDVCWYGWWITIGCLAVCILTEFSYWLHYRSWYSRNKDEMSDSERKWYGDS